MGYFRRKNSVQLKRGYINSANCVTLVVNRFLQMNLLRFLPFCFVLFDGCIEPFSADFQFSSRLVVDGLITDAPGPYEVKLFYNTPVQQTTKRPLAESDAIVSIIDDTGHAEPLLEVASGVYQTTNSTFVGVQGRSYHIQITTSRGRQYTSAPQRMMPAGALEDLYFEFEKDALSVTYSDSRMDAFHIYIDAKGTEGQPNLLRWRWKSTYEAHTFPELRTINTATSTVPAPLPCSGYIYAGGALSKLFECECCTCWPSEFSAIPIISENTNVAEDEFRKVYVGKIAVNGMHFYSRYHIEVEQLSVSEAEYEFWKLIKIQRESTGDLFQPNAVKVRGNITSGDPDDEVLGFFSVSAVKRKSIFIDRNDIVGEKPATDTLTIECIRAYPESVLEKPLFW
jgi:hypothetical protein